MICFRLLHAALYQVGPLLPAAVKFAVSVAGAFIVRFSGVVVVVTVPVNPANWLPVVAVPLIGTTVPAVNHPLGGLIDPSLDGFAAVVR